MTAYATLGARDLAQSYRFYDAVMPTIGWVLCDRYDSWRAYAKDGKAEGFALWIGLPFNGADATTGNGTMIGLKANSPAAVDAFYAAGLAHGGSSEGVPGLRPDYADGWYAAYLRDPAGNKLAVVHES